MASYITTTDVTTSILELVASVLIIPIVLGWIQEALSNKKAEQVDNKRIHVKEK